MVTNKLLFESFQLNSTNTLVLSFKAPSFQLSLSLDHHGGTLVFSLSVDWTIDRPRRNRIQHQLQNDRRKNLSTQLHIELTTFYLFKNCDGCIRKIMHETLSFTDSMFFRVILAVPNQVLCLAIKTEKLLIKLVQKISYCSVITYQVSKQLISTEDFIIIILDFWSNSDKG